MHRNYSMKLINAKNIFRLITILFVFISYYGLTTYGSFKFNFWNFEPCAYISYHPLTDAFLNGRVYLKPDPPKELISLKDPYDPGANPAYRWYDASYYKGKYYLYFGPSPVIFYCVFKALTGKYAPDNFIGLILTFGGFLFSALSLILIKDNLFKKAPEWILNLCILVLGFASYGTCLIQSTNACDVSVYTIAILGGYFFLNGGIFFTLWELITKKNNLILLFFAGLFLGLSVGGRAIYLIPTFIVVNLIIFFYLKITNKENFIQKGTAGIVFLLSYSFVLFLLGVYNFLRFDNPFQFGFKYQLSCFYFNKFYDLASLIPGIYFYLFKPLQIRDHFPYLFLNWDGTIPVIRPPLNFSIEDGQGIVPMYPFLVAPFLYIIYFLLFCKKEIFKKINIHKELFFIILLIISIINFLSIILYSGVNGRYTFDFLSCFLLISSILWLYFDSNFDIKIKIKSYIRSLIIISIFISLYTGLAVSVDSSKYSIRSANKPLFDKIESIVKPVGFFLPLVETTTYSYNKILEGMLYISIPAHKFLCFISKDINIGSKYCSKKATSYTFFFKKKLLPVFSSEKTFHFPRDPFIGQLWVVDKSKLFWFNGKFWIPLHGKDSKKLIQYGPIKMKIKFGKLKKNKIMPIIATGKDFSGDYMYVKDLTEDKILFGVNNHNMTEIVSKAITIDRYKFYDLEVSFGSFYPDIEPNADLVKKLEVWFDNKLILNKKMSFCPTKLEEIYIGKNPIMIGIGSNLVFDGEIVDITRNGLSFPK